MRDGRCRILHAIGRLEIARSIKILSGRYLHVCVNRLRISWNHNSTSINVPQSWSDHRPADLPGTNIHALHPLLVDVNNNE